MKILIADDHALVREGITHTLGRLGTDTLILEAADLDQALAATLSNPDLELVLLDLGMPGAQGCSGLQRIRSAAPATPIVILSASDDADTVRDAIRHGAKGFISKSSTGDVMLSAIKLVLSGGVFLPQSLLDRPAVTPPPTPAGDSLTPRQREVLQLLVEGKMNKEIARLLGMSDATVRTHVTAILRALNVKNRTQAGRVASQLGLVPD